MRDSTAGMSEASRFSPSPRPTMSGEDTFTPTRTSGSSCDTTTMAYAPSRSRMAARTASASPRPAAAFSSMRCAMHSVSVSDSRVCPSFSSRVRSSVKFSMIPLWMTATRPPQSAWGCALRSEGTPCVAHRVCPIPREPVRGEPSRACSSSASLPSRFTTSRPPSTTATILQTPQALEDDGEGVVGAHVAHDAAHEALRVAALRPGECEPGPRRPARATPPRPRSRPPP